jgi:hypothetical protein
MPRPGVLHHHPGRGIGGGEIPHPARMIEVDVREQDRRDIIEGLPASRQPVAEPIERARRSRIDEDGTAGRVEQSSRDDTRPAEELEVDRHHYRYSAIMAVPASWCCGFRIRNTSGSNTTKTNASILKASMNAIIAACFCTIPDIAA